MRPPGQLTNWKKNYTERHNLNLEEKINQPEGRRIEFKEVLPTNAELAKTFIAFANDAGGELFLGVKNEPREIVGLNKGDLDAIENQISNLINDNCVPALFPDISFVDVAGKHLIRVYIHKGGSPPYYLKSKGKEKGTFIRVGSSNRLANSEIIEELERIGAQRSFDGLQVHTITLDDLNYDRFQLFFENKTGESVSMEVLHKLELVKREQGREFPTNALILLSNDKVKAQLFPYAKVECARFKGTKPGDYIDQKTFDGSIVEHAELVLNFIKRHISEGTTGYDGVYRNDRWEYPIIALREVIRNAIIHRDYSLTGKDIKVAIFDDKIEITSPGKLMPTVDFNAMQAGQSDIRNKVLAPVFKRLGIIEQWGNGLSLIADNLADYPEIKMSWTEPGMAFRVSFLKLNYTKQVSKTVEETVEETVEKILSAISQNPKITAKQLQVITGLTRRGVEYNLDKLKKSGRLIRVGSTKSGYWQIMDI
jgi:predicted HTH transcriptional regulator